MPNEFYKKIGKGENILFLHGWGENKDTWLPLIAYLKGDFICWIIDLPAFGTNPAIESILTPMDYAMWIRDFILDKKIINYHLVGHSFGGRVAICLANADPKGIRGLVLYGTPGFREKPTLVSKIVVCLRSFGFKKLSFLKKNKIFLKFVTSLYSDDYKNSNGQLRKIFLAAINYDLVKQMEQINVPTYIINGEIDTFVSVATAKRMRSVIKNSQIKIVPRGSHFIHTENPLLFSGILKKIFNEK